MYFCVKEGRHHSYSTLQLTMSFSKKLLNQKKRNRNIQRKLRRLLLHMCSEQLKRGTVFVLVSSKSFKPGVNPYSFSQTLSLVYYGCQVISCSVCHLHLFLSHFHTLYRGLFLLLPSSSTNHTRQYFNIAYIQVFLFSSQSELVMCMMNTWRNIGTFSIPHILRGRKEYREYMKCSMIMDC